MGRIFNVCEREVQEKIDSMMRERVKSGLSMIYPRRKHYSIYDVSRQYILVNHFCSLVVAHTMEVFDYSPTEFQELMQSEWYEVREDYKYSGHTVPYDSCVSEEEGDATFLDMIVDSKASAPADEAVNMDIKDRLHDIVNRLPDKQRLVIEALFFCGRSELETAEMMGVSQPQVHYYKTRALKRLKILALEADLGPDEYEM